VKVTITSAKVDVAGDGTSVHVEWHLDSIASELKLTGFNVVATVQQVGSSKDDSTQVGSTQRKAIVRLSKEIKFSDISAVIATVVPIIEDPAPVVAAVSSRSIIGQGKNAAVRVTWNNPPPLPCSAAFYLISASALNEKNNKLSGSTTASLTKRSADVPLSGEINKQGLHDPQAAVTARGNKIICVTKRTFAPEQQGFAASGGANAPNPIVTIKAITIQDDGTGRTDSRINWDVVEPSGFRATKFDLKFDLEALNGQINSHPSRTVSGDQRSTFGPQVATGQFRNLIVTLTATFANSNNTSILTREDKQTRGLVIREATASTAKELAPASAPPTPNVGLEITGIKSGGKGVLVTWQVNPPTNVDVAKFTVEAQAGTTKHTVEVARQERQTIVDIALPKLGTNVQVKITALCRRNDGLQFQQTATRTQPLTQ
jgi:hypothetical protein